jgi:hypothetical protein
MVIKATVVSSGLAPRVVGTGCGTKHTNHNECACKHQAEESKIQPWYEPRTDSPPCKGFMEKGPYAIVELARVLCRQTFWGVQRYVRLLNDR